MLQKRGSTRSGGVQAEIGESRSPYAMAEIHASVPDNLLPFARSTPYNMYFTCTYIGYPTAILTP